MNQSNNHLMKATIFMIASQVIFAFVNFTYDVVSNPWNPILADGKLSSSSAVFWQYLIATLFTLPLIFRIGIKNLNTKNFFWHEMRALSSALGVQVFVYGFSVGVPVWQMVGLLLTGSFWVLLGSALFLGEKLTPARIGASLVGTFGALLILGVGQGSFSWASLLPVLAAMLWSTTSLISKYLAPEESAESLTLWLMVLIVLNHAVIGLTLVVLARLFPGLIPETLASSLDFSWPAAQTWIWIFCMGFLTALAQYTLWSAYKDADASYLQPFDDIKVPINVFIGWIALSQVPTFWFWPGVLLILGASSYMMRTEGGQIKQPPAHS